jgi:hypothetical protein
MRPTITRASALSCSMRAFSLSEFFFGVLEGPHPRECGGGSAKELTVWTRQSERSNLAK